ncbi:MAG: ABC transporter substrate-binding protein [Tissierellia bacterium]|nr:ABC transporter substrate-binding protein [Tissierellia bacterium]
MKRIVIIFIIALQVLLVSSCSQSKVYPVEPEEDQVDISLSDMMGVQIRLDQAAQEVVLMSVCAAQIVEELGARDQVAGIQSNLDFKNSSGLRKYSKEEIISGLVEGDLFIARDLDLTINERRKFYERGQNLLLLSIKEEGDIYRAVEIIGRALGKNLAAKEEIKYLSSAWQELSDKSSYKGRIYIERDGESLGRGSYISKSLDKLGFENVNEGQGQGYFSAKELKALKPDFLLVLGKEEDIDKEKFKDFKVLYFQEDNFYGINFVEEYEKLIKALK